MFTRLINRAIALEPNRLLWFEYGGNVTWRGHGTHAFSAGRTDRSCRVQPDYS